MFERIQSIPDDSVYKPAITLIASLLSFIITMQFVNLAHHWIVICLKWRIYKITVAYLRAAEDEQDQLATNITEMKDILGLIKTWYELTRIQTSRQKSINEDTLLHVDELKGHLVQAAKQTREKIDETGKKIDAIPDKVVDKIHSSESGTNIPTVKPGDGK